MLTLTLLMLVLFSTAYAQPDEIVPIPPAEVFAPDVQIVDVTVEIIPRETSVIEDQTVRTDDTSRMIEVYDAGRASWVRFPYPDGISQVVAAYLYADSQVLIASGYVYDEWGYSEPHYDYLLNLGNGLYAIPPRNCGMIIPADGRPMYHFDTDTRLNRTAICNVNTGERLALLPEGITGREVHVSPDERFLVVTARSDSSVETHVYSYDIEQRELYFQSTLSSSLNASAGLYAWYGDRYAVVTHGDSLDSTPVISSYYVIDATRSESSEWIYSQVQYEDFPILDTNFAWVNQGVGRGPNSPDVFPCKLTRFDQQTGFHTYEIGYDCPGWARTGDDYVVVRLIEQGDIPRLSYINGTTGEVRDIAIDANLQAVISTSTRFAAALMQNNIGNPYIAIYSLVSGDVVYRTGMAYLSRFGMVTTAEGLAWDRDQGFEAPFTWLMGNTLLVAMPSQRVEIALDGECCTGFSLPSSIRLVHLSDDAMAEIVYVDSGHTPIVLTTAPDYGAMVVLANRIQIADITHGEVVELFHPANPQRDQLVFDFEWLDSQILLVSYLVGSDQGCPPRHNCTVRYTVVPPLGD